jgi:hypothetical protein
MTTYDDLWTEFITNCKTDDINLPQTDLGKYNIIHSAIRQYKNRMIDTELNWDDTLETVNKVLDDNQIIIIAHYIRLSFLENQVISFSTIWQPFQKEIGVKNIREELSALRALVQDERKNIENIIMFSQEDYL